MHPLDPVVLGLSFLTTTLGMVATKLISDNRLAGWWLHLVNAVPFGALCIVTGAYFQLVACVVAIGLYARAIHKRREHAHAHTRAMPQVSVRRPDKLPPI